MKYHEYGVYKAVDRPESHSYRGPLTGPVVVAPNPDVIEPPQQPYYPHEENLRHYDPAYYQQTYQPTGTIVEREHVVTPVDYGHSYSHHYGQHDVTVEPLTDFDVAPVADVYTAPVADVYTAPVADVYTAPVADVHVDYPQFTDAHVTERHVGHIDHHSDYPLEHHAVAVVPETPVVHHEAVAVAHTAPVVHHDVQPVVHETTVVHADPVPHHTATVVQETPVVHATMVHHDAPVVHHTAPLVHHTAPVVHAAPTVHHLDPSAHIAQHHGVDVDHHYTAHAMPADVYDISGHDYAHPGYPPVEAVSSHLHEVKHASTPFHPGSVMIEPIVFDPEHNSTPEEHAAQEAYLNSHFTPTRTAHHGSVVDYELDDAGHVHMVGNGGFLN